MEEILKCTLDYSSGVVIKAVANGTSADTASFWNKKWSVLAKEWAKTQFAQGRKKVNFAMFSIELEL